VLLAEKLGVPVVIDFSGCPGDSDNAKYPNWVTCPWPPEYLDVLAWQWDKKVIPYWTEHAKYAKDHGVKIAIEMHPGFVVYSPRDHAETPLDRWRQHRVQFDPSHMFWQAIDPIAAIRVLGDSHFPRTRERHGRSMNRICRRLACSTRRSTRTSGIARGSSARSVTDTRLDGGKSSSQRCACTVMITLLSIEHEGHADVAG